LEHPVLFGRRQPGVERQDLGVVAGRPRDAVGRVTDLALARTEHQDVAGAGSASSPTASADACGLIALVAAVGVDEWPVADLHGVRTSRHLDHRGVVEVVGEALGVDGGRGDDQLQVRPAGEQAAEVAEQEVDVEAPLVGLVDDDGVVAAQQPVALDLGEQDPVGHHLDASVGADLVGEPDGVADLVRRQSVPNSSATRSAIDRAAMRRGWVWPIQASVPRPSSRQSLGSWVLLPDPVSPATITTWCAEIAASRSSRRSAMGRSAASPPAGARSGSPPPSDHVRSVR
jgi:hypothetical protein